MVPNLEEESTVGREWVIWIRDFGFSDGEGQDVTLSHSGVGNRAQEMVPEGEELKELWYWCIGKQDDRRICGEKRLKGVLKSLVNEVIWFKK